MSPDFTKPFLSFCDKSGLLGWPSEPVFSPVQICFLLFQIFYVIPCRVNPVGNNYMMTKASLRRGRQRDGSVLGIAMSPAPIASAGLMTPICLRCCCPCYHHLVLIVFVTVWHHCCRLLSSSPLLPLFWLLPSLPSSPSLPLLPLSP